MKARLAQPAHLVEHQALEVEFKCSTPCRARCQRLDHLRKPLPASPARAASMVALSARPAGGFRDGKAKPFGKTQSFMCSPSGDTNVSNGSPSACCQCRMTRIGGSTASPFTSTKRELVVAPVT